MRKAGKVARNGSPSSSGNRTVVVRPQQSFWTVKNDRIIDEVNHLGSKDFLEKLKARDSQAWDSVKTLIVEPIFHQQKYAEMAKEKSIDVGDAWGYLCLTMLEGGRINRSRDPDTLKGWMQGYVRKFIREFFSEKEKRFVSAQAHFGRVTQGEDKGGGRIVEDPIAKIPDAVQETRRGETITFDEKSLIQDEFHKLWKKNPQKAYVLMFKMREDLSSKDIQKICKISSSSNVDKILERAKKDMAVALAPKLSMERSHLKGCAKKTSVGSVVCRKVRR